MELVYIFTAQPCQGNIYESFPFTLNAPAIYYCFRIIACTRYTLVRTDGGKWSRAVYMTTYSVMHVHKVTSRPDIRPSPDIHPPTDVTHTRTTHHPPHHFLLAWTVAEMSLALDSSSTKADGRVLPASRPRTNVPHERVTPSTPELPQTWRRYDEPGCWNRRQPGSKESGYCMRSLSSH